MDLLTAYLIVTAGFAVCKLVRIQFECLTITSKSWARLAYDLALVTVWPLTILVAGLAFSAARVVRWYGVPDLDIRMAETLRDYADELYARADRLDPEGAAAAEPAEPAECPF